MHHRQRLRSLTLTNCLRETIPSAFDVVTVSDAKLFFAEDRPQALLEPLRAFLDATHASQRDTRFVA